MINEDTDKDIFLNIRYDHLPEKAPELSNSLVSDCTIEILCNNRYSGIPITNGILPDSIAGIIKNNRFIVTGAKDIIKTFLAFNIDIDIRHDMKCLEIAQNFASIDNYENTCNDDNYSKSDIYDTHDIYNCSKELLNNPIYTYIVNAHKVFAYGEYYGLEQDVDKINKDRYINTTIEKMSKSRENILEMYSIDITNKKECVDFLNRLLGIHIRGLTVRKLQRMENLFSFDTGLYSSIIKYAIRERRLSRLTYDSKAQFFIRKNLELSSKFPMLKESNLHVNSLVHTNTRTHYYIALDISDALIRYVDKTNLNILTDNIDYHAYCASLVYKKSIEDVNPAERRYAKIYNNYRSISITGDHVHSLEDDMHRTLGKDTCKFQTVLPLNKNTTPYEFNVKMLECISKFYNKTSSTGLTKSITLSYTNRSRLVFRVQKSVEPEVSVPIIASSFKFSNCEGFNLFNKIRISTNYSNILLRKESDNFNLTVEDIMNGEYNVLKERINNTSSYTYTK